MRHFFERFNTMQAATAGHAHGRRGNSRPLVVILAVSLTTLSAAALREQAETTAFGLAASISAAIIINQARLARRRP